ncbi:MAG TPA: arginine deiminase-related protein [Chitinophagales bacterium]|nr:arginine deiminase-related protein [Chitinophagales bacterium]
MFTTAITRKPCSRFSEGITTAHLGKPDLQLALQQHGEYIAALKTCGLEVIELDADENFPDSCFVEDVAVITKEIAVITNPGAESRRREIHSMIPVLEKFRKLFFIEPPGTLEGGDVMQIVRGTPYGDKHFYIGITERTNEEGAHQLRKILSHFGYDCTLIPVTSALHLKSVVNYIGNNNLLASKEFISHPAFKNFNIIEIADDDLYAANCLLVNNMLIIPKGFDRVKSQLMKLGTGEPHSYNLGTGEPYPYNMIELNMTEFEKMDGGLTCLSLRFS